MSHRIDLEPAFVLHTRPYSNTSLIVELLSRQYGRVAVIARSARGLKSRYRGVLQAFTPMLVSWSGRRDLKTLGNLELDGPPMVLEGRALLSGFYLNELLLRLLLREDPYPLVFDAYHDALKALSAKTEITKVLRCFEKRLLTRLGYGLPLTREANTHEPIDIDAHYHYLPERGFVRVQNSIAGGFSGRTLLAIHHEQFDDQAVLQSAKRLMRQVLSQYLGDRPLKSRELFI